MRQSLLNGARLQQILLTLLRDGAALLDAASFESFLYSEDSPSERQMGGRGRLLSSELAAAAAVAAGGTFLR